jgi:hypothetical protein
MSGLTLSPSERDTFKIVTAVRQLMEGRSNAVGSLTLTAGTTSTAVSAPNCGPSSEVFLSPRTANAAGALGTTYVSAVASGSFTLTHANAATTDRTFGYETRG